MKFKKTIALLLTLILAVCGTSLVAFAAADVDFTLRPDTTQTSEFAPGDTVNLYVDITTKTSNGYNNFTLEIGYNSDVLTYSDQAIDENGCTGNASGGVLTLTYNNPEGKNSAVNDVKHIKVAFTVLEGAPGGDTEFSSKVTCYGKDTTGTQKLRTCAPMLNKKITISDISNGVTASAVSPADYPVTSEILVDDIPSVYERDEEEEKSGIGAGWVIILILLAFGGGFIAGFKLCEKRTGGSGTGARRPFPTRGGSDVPDDDDDELPTFSKKTPARKPLQAEDDTFDSSYFGRAREMGSGNDIFDKYASDDDYGMSSQPANQGYQSQEDESGFPGSFFPRNYTSRAPQRNDDGFGSFGSDGQSAGGGYANNDMGGYGGYGNNDFGSYGGGSSFGSSGSNSDRYSGGSYGSSGSGFEDSDFDSFGGFGSGGSFGGSGGFGGFEDDDNYRSRRR